VQKTGKVARGTAGGNYTIRLSEYGLHMLRFDIKIAVIPLDDTEGVNPQIALPQRSRGDYGVVKSCRD
jgi:hypothetical protein